MHLLATDVLTCPRCGPRFGLILLADRLERRRVLAGRLGCSNCRSAYPIMDGFAELRPGGATQPLAAPAPGDEEGSIRLAALLGLTEGRGLVLLIGSLARWAPGVAAAVDGVEVLALDGRLRGWTEQGGVSRLGAFPGLPFFDRSLRGVALGGEEAVGLLDEAARVVAPLGRLLIDGASAGTEARLTAAGLEVLAAEDGILVAGRARV